MYEVVKNRVDSSLYLNHLGIVHKAQQDLRRLSDSMFHKYEQEQSAENDDLKSNAMVKQEEPASTCWWRCCSSKKSNDKQQQPSVKSKDTHILFPRGEPRIEK